MAMTQTMLAIFAALATLGTLGLFVDTDPATQAVTGFIGAIVWGMFGLSSYDVIVRQTSFATASEPIYPAVYLGIGLAIIVGLFSFKRLLEAVRSETEATDPDSILP